MPTFSNKNYKKITKGFCVSFYYIAIQYFLSWLPMTCIHQFALDLKESLFYLVMPLEHMDFHIIGYWTSSMRSL